jgi:hypothetical protein
MPPKHDPPLPPPPLFQDAYQLRRNQFAAHVSLLNLACSGPSYVDSAQLRADGCPGAGQRVRGAIQEPAFGGSAVA